MKYFKKYSILYGLIFICNSFLLAQQVISKNYNVNDGLPSSECYWVMQDSKHFLWIATDAGVVKYDGYKFITYNNNKGLPDNTVFKIHEDKHGRIWFSTYSGKMAYYLHQTDSIYEIPCNNKLRHVVSDFILDFCFDKKDTLWASIGNNGYLKIVPPSYQTFIQYHLPSQSNFLIEKDNEAFIFGIESKSKYLLKDSNSKFFYIPHNSKKTPIIFPKSITNSPNTHLSSIKIKNQDYLLSNDNHIYNITTKGVNEITTPYIKNVHSIINLFKDRQNKIWVNTSDHGSFLFDNNKLNTVPQQFFINDCISNVFEDVDHGLWFTSTNHGLNYIPSLNFKCFNSINETINNKVYAISIINNVLYYAVDNFKINSLNLKTKEILKNVIKNYGTSLYSFDDNLVYSKNPHTLIFNINTKKSIDITIASNDLNNTESSVKKIIDFDKDSLIGYNPSSFIYKISKHTGFATKIINIPSRIFSVYSNKKVIYIGTKQGLYKFQNNQLICLGDSIPLLSCRIEAITSVHDTLFLATKGFGVIVYTNHKIIAQFNETNGLASNICKSIFKAKDHSIWIGTNRGISRLKLDETGKYNCNTINLLNGLVSNEINQMLEYEDQLYFATNNGIGYFKINDAFDEQKQIPVNIEKCLINNLKIDFSKTLDLNYDENFMQIFYKGIYLKNEGDITYKYRLEGLDTNWTVTKNIFVQFTTLPAGQYKFVVYAINSNGSINSKPAIVLFNIQKPFWKTWWFYLLIILIIATLIVIIYKKRVSYIWKIENQRMLTTVKIAEYELKALRSQMNPHFMFNAINSIQNFVLKNDSKSAQKYLTKFARLIRSVLENSKHEFVLLTKEVEALELYIELEALRAGFSFDYEIIIDESLDSGHFHIPPMIIQPYVENAILHGLVPLTDKRGKLTLNFSHHHQTLNCIIDDNGIGRKKAMELKHKKDLGKISLGMEISEDRIELLNIQTNLFTIVNVIDKQENGVSVGTRIEISIELKTKK